MRLHDLEFIKLLPVFMRKDLAVKALAETVDDLLADPDFHLKDLPAWDRIDFLTEDELDYLAWEFDIDWYDFGADQRTKARQIKSALLIKKKRGTKWAVEQILADIYGWAYVREWFETEERPYTFEVVVKNPITTQEMFDRMLAMVDKAKNVRSILLRTYFLTESKATIELLAKWHDNYFHFDQAGDLYTGNICLDGVHLDQVSQGLYTKEHENYFRFKECGTYWAGTGRICPLYCGRFYVGEQKNESL